MATTTTNLGLIKPAGTDKIRIAQINGNMDIIDEKVGAVGNTSLQTQVTGLGVNLAGLEDCVGIVVDGAKSAVAAAAGQYIVLKNSIISGCDDGLYTAAQAIPADTTIDSTYLTAVSGGGLNALNTQIANKLKSTTLLNSVALNGSGSSTWAYSGQSFTLDKAAFVYAAAWFTSAACYGLGIGTASDSYQHSMPCRQEDSSITTQSIFAYLGPGTYYLWVKTSSRCNGSVTKFDI